MNNKLSTSTTWLQIDEDEADILSVGKIDVVLPIEKALGVV